MAGPVCIKCNDKAITFIRYSGAHLCAKHFNEFFLKRVKREVRWQGGLRAKGKIMVAISGGKDSGVALRTLLDLYRNVKGLSIEAMIVDEGISGYRPLCLKVAKENCRRWEVPLHVITFKQMTGMSLDTIIKTSKGLKPCAICGVFRRYGMNQVAKEHGAHRLATGHNLDDLAQSILMNVATGDLEKMFRLGPHLSPIGGLVPRFFPLRSIPEKEILLYAMTNGIPFMSAECPYADTATRGRYRDVLMRLEDQDPGTRHSLLNFHQALIERSPEMRKDLDVVHCITCGEPSAGTECKRCQYLKRIVQMRPVKKTKNDH